MKKQFIDLRSDTATRPTAAMRRAMAEAEVGDDVQGEDPNVNELERKFAELLGKEAAVYVPSGTMANQIGIGIHTRPGDELICDSSAHVYVWEAGGIARLWGVTPRPIPTENGLLDVEYLAGKLRPDDPHYVRSRLIWLENTHNRAGGRIHPIESIAAISEWARSQGLAMHLDGARLMNAVVASGIPAKEWAKHFDTVQMCFSKGLGAPVGSAIAGTAAMIRAGRRLRKVLGGSMRQAGIIAAGALYALNNNVERLAEDHANAQILARAIERTEGLSLESPPVETNLVWFQIDPALGTAATLQKTLREHGVIVSTPGGSVLRACTHLDVTRADVEHVAELLPKVVPALQHA